MRSDKRQVIKFINIIKKRLNNYRPREINISIKNTDNYEEMIYQIDFKRYDYNYKESYSYNHDNINEVIKQFISNIVNLWVIKDIYQEIKLEGYVDYFLEEPTSLLFELFNTVNNEHIREKIYQSIFGPKYILENMNCVSRKYKNNPDVYEKIIKFLIKEEIKSDEKHVGSLYTIINCLEVICYGQNKENKINIKIFEKELINLLSLYKPLIINEDNENKGTSSYHNIRDKIQEYLKKCDIDNDTWLQCRQYFPVGKNNGHIKEVTENELFDSGEYNFHNIVLLNEKLLSYYENTETTIKIKTMMEKILSVFKLNLKIKPRELLNKCTLTLIEDQYNKDEQHIVVKINKKYDNEKIIKDIKIIMVTMMNAYQNCMNMDEKEKKNYLDKSLETILLSIKLENKEIVKTGEIKRLKI